MDTDVKVGRVNEKDLQWAISIFWKFQFTWGLSKEFSSAVDLHSGAPLGTAASIPWIEVGWGLLIINHKQVATGTGLYKMDWSQKVKLLMPPFGLYHSWTETTFDLVV